MDKRINLLPKTNSALKRERLWDSASFLITIPGWYVLAIAYGMCYLPYLLLSKVRRASNTSIDPDKPFREYIKMCRIELKTMYRQVRAIEIPLVRRGQGKTFPYIGYELDNPIPFGDPFDDHLASLECGACGTAGTLTDSLGSGMLCPCCKSDTLESVTDRPLVELT